MQNEEFVLVAPGDQVPATRHVRGSNYTLINVFADRVPGRAVIVSVSITFTSNLGCASLSRFSLVSHSLLFATQVIDNLVKGASGQAIQNMNLVLGFSEQTGLGQQPLFP